MDSYTKTQALRVQAPAYLVSTQHQNYDSFTFSLLNYSRRFCGIGCIVYVHVCRHEEPPHTYIYIHMYIYVLIYLCFLFIHICMAILDFCTSAHTYKYRILRTYIYIHMHASQMERILPRNLSNWGPRQSPGGSSGCQGSKASELSIEAPLLPSAVGFPRKVLASL